VAYESVYADEQEEGLLVRCIRWDGGMSAFRQWLLASPGVLSAGNWEAGRFGAVEEDTPACAVCSNSLLPTTIRWIVCTRAKVLSHGVRTKSQTEVKNVVSPASRESEGWLKPPFAQRRSLESIRRVVPSASACGTR